MNKIIFSLSFLLVAVAVAVAVGYLGQDLEFPALTITAPHSNANEVPVYAQFTITQSFILHKSADVILLQVPMKVTSSNNDHIQFDLRQKNELVQRWRVEAKNLNKKDTALLSFDPPTTLKGAYELSVSASNITIDQKDTAPVVYVELDNNSYPDGNYRIANNQKKGDMGLALMQHKTRLNLLLEYWSGARNHATVTVSLLLSLLILLGSFPYVLARILGIGQNSCKN